MYGGEERSCLVLSGAELICKLVHKGDGAQQQLFGYATCRCRWCLRVIMSACTCIHCQVKRWDVGKFTFIPAIVYNHEITLSLYG